MRALRYRALWLAGGWLLVLFIVLGSLAPSSGGPEIVSDKLVHLLSYAVLALWFGGIVLPSRFPWLAAALLALGLVLEFAQGVSGYRSMEMADALANGVGVIAGLALARRAPGDWCGWLERWIPGHET